MVGPHILDSLRNIEVLTEAGVKVDRPLKGFCVLDVGCGCGFLSEALARLGCNVTGIDAVPETKKSAKEHALRDESIKNLQYSVNSIQDYANDIDESFDVVVASKVLEHVKDKKEFLEASVKCLKPGGSLFITTINRNFFSRIFSIFFQENVFKTIPKGLHEHDMCVTPQEVTNVLKSNNCTIKSIYGMYYLINRWYWIPTTSTWYFLHAIKNK